MSNVPNNVIVNEDTPNTVIINQDAQNQVVVRLGGAAGNSRRHVHTQSSPSTTWVINHSLGGKPSVMVVDTADTVVIGEVTYNSNSQVTVEFTVAFSGYAYLT
jgi:RNA:NAD 2'-phosphotransferase (TPT1/KptA family)